MSQEPETEPPAIAQQPDENLPLRDPATDSAHPDATTSQEPQEPANAKPLDTIFLRDSNGNLVPVLGISFEEFERLLRLKRGLAPPPPPAYVISRLTLDGTQVASVAKFKVTLDIQIRDEGWVPVPIRFDKGVIDAPAQYMGPGEHFLAPDAEGGGYICWLKGKDSKLHALTFTASFPIQATDGELRLAANLPLATESLLRLAAPQRIAEASLAEGEGIVATAAVPGGGSELTVLGASGDLVLVWRQSPATQRGSLRRLDATGHITVRIESEHRISSDARLRIRSLGQPLDAFTVQLPPTMELAPLPPVPEYTITEIEGDRAPAAANRRRQVTVQLAKPTAAAEIVLRAQRDPIAAAKADFRPADFVIDGAVRQRGTIDFLSEGDWQLDWSDESSVHRLDTSAESAPEQLVARYEYFRQPCDLVLRVAVRPSRLSVEPTHMVYVDPRQLRLETLLKCRFRGARAGGLRLQLGDWKFDRLTPEALFDLPVTTEQGEVFLPFRTGAQIPPELELRLEAHRSLEGTVDQVSFDLPRPAATNIAPGAVLVFAADNIELNPSATEIVGLSPETTTVRLPGRQQAPLVYRDLGGGETVRFVASARTLKRVTTVAGRARVRIDGQQMQIEQRLDYRVAHEPQRVFPLLAPSEVVAAGNLQVLLDDQPLAFSPASQAESNAGLLRLTTSTPADQIGSFQVLVRYALPLRWNRRVPLQLSIPLVSPIVEQEDQFAGQQIEFSLGDGMQIEPDLEGLGDATEPVPLTGSAVAYSWPGRPLTTSWLLESAQTSDGTGIAVSQMWAQSWLSPRVRQERVAMRIRADRESLLVKIDRSVKQSSVQTAVDGREVPRTFRQPGVLVVTLPAAVRGRECVVEVSYTVDPAPPSFGLMRQEWRAAQIEDAQPPRRIYWQLVLPAHQHLLLGPAELTSEMVWPASRWFTRPRPVFDQRQLEAWINATPQESLPQGANAYLYGALSRWPAAQVTVVSRPALVLLTSSAVLLVGLLLIHVPLLRRAELVAVSAIGLSAGALLAPELALLVAQASVFGLIVILGVAAWTWATARPAPPRVPVAPAAAPRESRSTRPPAKQDRSSRVTTTAPGHAAIVEVRP